MPPDANGIASSPTPDDVVNIVYLKPFPVSQGGFFPAVVNAACA
ncbi:hypothetical protein [Xylophilus sp. GOD-11R]|nr:hypothetical protein [Xylophilus sp. GOD-11R]WPB57904.1 hypothetical protein R9X41_04465 [Xylophilus sp. GOD-11R]